MNHCTKMKMYIKSEVPSDAENTTIFLSCRYGLRDFESDPFTAHDSSFTCLYDYNLGRSDPIYW